jgi:hypothetical protein
MEKAFDLVHDRWEIGGWGDVAVDRELNEGGSGYAPRQVSAPLEIDPAVARVV